MKATPSSIVVLHGECGAYFYNEGFLIYEQNFTLRILDVYNAAPTEKVIDIIALAAYIVQSKFEYSREMREMMERPEYGQDCECPNCERQRKGQYAFKSSILYYQNGILFIEIETYHEGSYCVGIDIHQPVENIHQCIKYIRRIRWRNCHMRTDGRYLMHAERSTHCGWNFRCYDTHKMQCTLPAFGLDQCFDVSYRSHHPGMCFKQFDDWFYILDVTEETYDDRWYYCYRFHTSDFHPRDVWKYDSNFDESPTNPPPRSLEIVRIERPRLEIVPDGTTNTPVTFHLHQDEYTGLLYIVELQRESTAISAKRETYYIQPFSFPTSPARTLHEPNMKIHFVQTLEAKNIPPPSRHPCPLRPSPNIVQRSYLPDVRTFLDGIYYRPGFVVGSPKSFALVDEGVTGRSVATLPTGSPIKFSEADQPTVSRFPSRNIPPNLSEFLAPVSQDQIYQNSYHEFRTVLSRRAQRLVLFVFDPAIRFTGLKKINVASISDQISYDEYEKELSVVAQIQEKDKNDASETNSGEVTGQTLPPIDLDVAKKQWFCNEPARWVGIAQGYQLRTLRET